MDGSVQSWSNLRIEYFKILAFEFLLQSTKILDHPLIQPSPFLWSTAQLPWEIMNKYIPQSWILSSNKQMLLDERICQNEDPKHAVFVGLPHNPLKISPHWGRKDFWLTVLTGIPDPELVFGFFSSHVVMCVLIHWRPKDWTLADKLLKKTSVDLLKRFSIYHACPKCLAAYRCGSTFPQKSLAFRQELDEMGKTQVDWQRGNVHCVLIQHL